MNRETRDMLRGEIATCVDPKTRPSPEVVLGKVLAIQDALLADVVPEEEREHVPDWVHERGWQWRPVGDDAFAPPFGTVRVCRCGCLVAGGLTACARCAQGGANRGAEALASLVVAIEKQHSAPAPIPDDVVERCAMAHASEAYEWRYLSEEHRRQYRHVARTILTVARYPWPESLAEAQARFAEAHNRAGRLREELGQVERERATAVDLVDMLRARLAEVEGEQRAGVAALEKSHAEEVARLQRDLDSMTAERNGYYDDTEALYTRLTAALGPVKEVEVEALCEARVGIGPNDIREVSMMFLTARRAAAGLEGK